MSIQRVQVLDTLLALKAIALSEQLIGNQKRVAAALIDHFNRKTGQCDPSLDTLAALLGISRRTVIRTMLRLERVGFFRRVRHGGHFHRNLYEPVWATFREHEADWKRRRSRHGASLREQKMSRSQDQACHPADASVGTQTCLINQSKETFDEARSGVQPHTPNSSTQLKRLGKEENDQTTECVSSTFHVKRNSSRNAAQDSAERRWSDALTRCYSPDQRLYAQIIEAIDPQLHHEATLAELAKPGEGVRRIVDRMRALKILGDA